MRAYTVALLAVVASCGDKKQERKSVDPWATGSGAAITKPLPEYKDEPWRLVVEAPGAEPRAVLSYEPATIDRELSFHMIDTEHRDHVVADMRYRWTCAPCKYRMTKFGDDDAPEEIRRDFARIAKEIYGDVAVPPDGHPEVKPATIMSTTPSTIELFELVIVPFPAEPIGVGARWTVTDGPKTKRYELISRDDQGASVKLDFVAEVPDAKVEEHGTLAVTFADPASKGVLEQTQTMSMSGGSDSFSLHMRVTFE